MEKLGVANSPFFPIPRVATCGTVPCFLEQIEERKYEHPYHIDEVPIKAGYFDPGGRVFVAERPNLDRRQRNDSRQNMQPVESQ